MDIKTNNISFNGKIGPNLLKSVTKEFNYDAAKVNKFEKLFEDSYSPNIDSNTVIDTNKSGMYVFAHNAFSKVKYKSNKLLNTKHTVTQSLLNECPKIFSSIENRMFRTIIAKSVNKGISFEELMNHASEILNSKSKNSYLENIMLAQRIKKEKPKSKLYNNEFDWMSIKVMEEEAATPGTKLYELIHNFGKSSFE